MVSHAQIDMSRWAVVPFSAAVTAPALRNPWTRPGTPASTHLPVAEAPNCVRYPGARHQEGHAGGWAGVDHRCSSGKMGDLGPDRLAVAVLLLSHPLRTCCRPRRTTSDRRTPVHSSSTSARRALEPTGWCSSNWRTSSTVQAWRRVDYQVARRIVTISSSRSAHLNMTLMALTRLTWALGTCALRSHHAQMLGLEAREREGCKRLRSARYAGLGAGGVEQLPALVLCELVEPPEGTGVRIFVQRSSRRCQWPALSVAPGGTPWRSRA
jgi:hypothetical protein